MSIFRGVLRRMVSANCASFHPSRLVIAACGIAPRPFHRVSWHVDLYDLALFSNLKARGKLLLMLLVLIVKRRGVCVYVGGVHVVRNLLLSERALQRGIRMTVPLRRLLVRVLGCLGYHLISVAHIYTIIVIVIKT